MSKEKQIENSGTRRLKVVCYQELARGTVAHLKSQNIRTGSVYHR